MWSHTQTLNEKGLSVSKKFPKGTAVIAIVGATIGNTGLLAYDMCFPDSLVGLETGTPEGNRFVQLFLRHRKHAIRRSSYSSGGQPNIKLESLILSLLPCLLLPNSSKSFTEWTSFERALTSFNVESKALRAVSSAAHRLLPC